MEHMMEYTILVFLVVAFCTFAVAFEIFSRTCHALILGIENGIIAALAVVLNTGVLCLISFLVLTVLVIVRLILWNSNHKQQYGDYAVYGKDVRVRDKDTEDIAPIEFVPTNVEAMPNDQEDEREENASEEQDMNYHYNTQYKPTKKKKWAKRIICTIVIACLAIIAVAAIPNIIKKFEDFGLEPVAEPRSGEILSGMEVYGASKITITASSDESYVVKLKTRSGVERLSFYVRAGETVTVGVPCEVLQVYFASGSAWYGDEHLFGVHTDYAKDNNLCDFAEYTWSYTLYPVYNGNFDDTPIDEDEF